MDCVNHTGVNATAYCQNCGKALCPGCVREAAGGQILCEPCWMAWQSYQQPFVIPPAGMPSPAAAAALGMIPGVGAMYNGQLIKGLIHVVIFAVLVSAANFNGIFGIFIAAWIAYQMFEAYYTAKARRDGTPLPDPLGLNEAGNWFNRGGRPQDSGAAPVNSPQPPFAGQYQAPYQQPYTGPYAPPAPNFTVAGMPPMPPIPPVPPIPPSACWRRREPIGAIILIALGVLFLLQQFDLFSGRVFEFAWPVLLIGLGIWLIVRRIGESEGDSK